MEYTAHVDTWVRDRLPPEHQRPQLIFDLPELQFPARINCATAVLDRNILLDRGASPCVRDAHGVHTYADVVALTNRIAGVLVDDLEVLPGERVLLMGYNGVTLLAAWFAVMKTGAVAVSAVPSLRPREVADVLRRAQVGAALVDHRVHGCVTEALEDGHAGLRLASWGSGGDLESRLDRKPADFTAVQTAADDPCVIAFTSGSTGSPKAAVHTHRDIVATCAIFAGAPMRATSADVFAGSPPLAFTFGLMALGCYPLYLGASVVLAERAGADELVRLVEQHRATLCFTVPTVYRKWLRDGVDPERLASLRVAVSSAEPLSRQDWLAFKQVTGLAIVNVLGSTEMLHAFMSTGVAPARPGSVGKPIRGYQATVLDDSDRPLPPGSVGRLAVRGVTGCVYLDDDRQAGQVRHGWTLTGDRAHQDEEGYFWLDGRTDEVVVSSGYTVSPAEVEMVLMEHPGVSECLVVALPDPVKGSVLKGVVVATESLPKGADGQKALIDHVLARAAPYKCPALIEIVDELPRTPTGKIRRTLPSPA